MALHKMNTQALRTWDSDNAVENWVYPQPGVFWGHCESHSRCGGCPDEYCPEQTYVLECDDYVNRCAGCDRLDDRSQS
jgi:hypothetical protein